jgi:hypothetical protein
MKSKLFLIVAFLITSFSVKATTNETENRYYYENGNNFTFVESGITFAVFQNGEFDFYINPRNGVNIGLRSRNLNISFNSGYNYDAYVQYDDFGAVIQVENVPIYYDYYGRVTQIGNVNINYRNGRLVRLGGLRVFYNNYGYYTHYSGYVNRYNRYYAYHPYHNYFVRPLFDYRIVSYKPYRHYYRPNRYTYYGKHHNKYYKKGRSYNGYKRNTYNTRKRFATNKIPKRRNEHIANNTKRNYKNYRRNQNTNGNIYKRNNSAINRTNGNRNVTKRRTVTETHRKPSNSYGNKKRNTVYKKTVISRKPAYSNSKKRVNTIRKNVKTNVKRGISKSSTYKKPLKRKSSKIVNSKRRG